jgi:hypothetical protein
MGSRESVVYGLKSGLIWVESDAIGGEGAGIGDDASFPLGYPASTSMLLASVPMTGARTTNATAKVSAMAAGNRTATPRRGSRDVHAATQRKSRAWPDDRGSSKS